jgi:hypothetical protein
MRTKFLLENLKGGNHTKDIDVDGRIILKCILARVTIFLVLQTKTFPYMRRKVGHNAVHV